MQKNKISPATREVDYPFDFRFYLKPSKPVSYSSIKVTLDTDNNKNLEYIMEPVNREKINRTWDKFKKNEFQCF